MIGVGAEHIGAEAVDTESTLRGIDVWEQKSDADDGLNDSEDQTLLHAFHFRRRSSLATVTFPTDLDLCVTDVGGEAKYGLGVALPHPRPLRVVVMGVAASGKTTVAEGLAATLHATYLEADTFHPEANIAKMSNGIPLTDEDRWPWLSAMRDALASADRVVVTCSALKKSYRDLLRSAGSVQFVFLAIDRSLAHDRIAGRKGHFMTAQMVDSQFATLEVPGSDEPDVIAVDARLTVQEIVANYSEMLLEASG